MKSFHLLLIKINLLLIPIGSFAQKVNVLPKLNLPGKYKRAEVFYSHYNHDNKELTIYFTNDPLEDINEYLEVELDSNYAILNSQDLSLAPNSLLSTFFPN